VRLLSLLVVHIEDSCPPACFETGAAGRDLPLDLQRKEVAFR